MASQEVTLFSLIKSAQMYNKKILVELLSSHTIGCTPRERSSSYHFIQHLDPFCMTRCSLEPNCYCWDDMT
jgi:hypothetical protein